MTPAQKERIILLRTTGYSYREIADQIGATRDAVISFCRRHLPKQAVVPCHGSEQHDNCRRCGKQLHQQKKMKRRTFCSDECRIRWWSEHPEMLNRKAVYYFTCAHCGKSFAAYGDSGRKYCSHECYIGERFGES